MASLRSDSHELQVSHVETDTERLETSSLLNVSVNHRWSFNKECEIVSIALEKEKDDVDDKDEETGEDNEKVDELDMLLELKQTSKFGANVYAKHHS